MDSQYDVVVIGAGAAGLMCTIEAGTRSRRVAVVEHADAVGKKILISGGGRCNFTNLFATPDVYLSGNPHFAISALSRYTPADFIALVERHDIAYHEKKLGQLFCDDSAKQIVDMLLRECGDAGVDLHSGCTIEDVSPNAGGFRVETSLGTTSCESLVVATGGLSIPKMGATSFGHDVARRFGLQVTETRPGLVPLTFRGDDLALFRSLAGASADCTATCAGVTWRENLLFTHRGLSGPAILQVSSHWREGLPVEIDLLPDVADAAQLLHDERERQPQARLDSVIGEHMPRRLAEALCHSDGSRSIGSISNKALETLAQMLKRWTLAPSGTEGYRVAEVTVGGVDTAELSSQTMEARSVPGLFFIGEVVDVTGPLGGYNFQWAWASGYAAGQVA